MAPHSPKTGFQNCPILGVGIGLREPIFEKTLIHNDIIDWLEIIPEAFLDVGGFSSHMLREARKVYPLIPHGIGLNVGGTTPWDERLLSGLDRLLEEIDAPWFSDHLVFAQVNGMYSNDLLPLPRTDEAVRHCIDRIHYLQDRYQRPFLIENPSYYYDYPIHEMGEGEFYRKILEGADCGMLLDVNNVYVCSRNIKYDAYEFLNALPLERVVQLHMAGHHEEEHLIIDTHGADIRSEVWVLCEWVLKHTRPCGVLIERDQNIPQFEVFAKEIIQMRKLWYGIYGPDYGQHQDKTVLSQSAVRL